MKLINSMFFPTMQSTRVFLREHLDCDKVPYFQLLSNVEAIRYYGRAPINNIVEACAEINELHVKYINMEVIKWAITLNSTGQYIGSVGVKDFCNCHRRGTLSCILMPSFWHLGYAYEALKLVVHFAFETLSLNRLQVYVDPLNIKAVRLFEKLGFALEANLSEYELENMNYIDIAILGLIKSTYYENEKNFT